jgi:hypothetical protein
MLARLGRNTVAHCHAMAVGEVLTLPAALVPVKPILGLIEAVEAPRHRCTAARLHRAAIVDGESLPLQPKPPYLHGSMQGLMEITRVGLVF